jgi:hypothetical protein
MSWLSSAQVRAVHGTNAVRPNTACSRPLFRQQATSTRDEEQTIYARHEWWDTGSGWKNILNNVRLITQPYIFCCLLLPWLNVFHIPRLYEDFRTLINAMNGFQCHIPI